MRHFELAFGHDVFIDQQFYTLYFQFGAFRIGDRALQISLRFGQLGFIFFIINTEQGLSFSDFLTLVHIYFFEVAFHTSIYFDVPQGVDVAYVFAVQFGFLGPEFRYGDGRNAVFCLR
ncbi:hypothetical protein D3C86_1859590 [compost metagenome]